MNNKTKNNNTEILWHTKNINDVLYELGSNIISGLTEEEVKIRLNKFGYNELEGKKGRSPLKIFLSQFNDLIIWILIAAAFISGIIMREMVDAIVILIILFANSVLGFIQEYKAEKALEAIKELASPTAVVLRNGVEKKINSKLLVPGDIIKLSAGDLVPADCRVLNETNLLTNEAPITGESLPVEKSVEPLSKITLPLGDTVNMVFSSTTIVKGRCIAVVTDSGNNTEIGKIANLVQNKEEQTPLQKELKTVGKRISVICLAASALVLISGVIKGNAWMEMFLIAVALAVAAIPEGLPAIVTVSLALGVQRMAKNNAIIRRLSSVETLGGVSVICTDKTGTLTQNKMIVKKIYAGLDEFTEYDKLLKTSILKRIEKSNDIKNTKTHHTKIIEEDPVLKLLFQNAVLCNDAYYIDKKTQKILGDPTEAALIDLGALYSFDRDSLESILPREFEEPFDSIRKMMTTVHRITSKNEFIYKSNSINGKSMTNIDSKFADNKTLIPKYVVFSKGAPEVIIKKCNRIIKEDTVRHLSENDKKEINNINSRLAMGAMRNLAFAFTYIDYAPDEKEIKKLENELIFTGMVGMIDPPRPEVYDAIEKCKKAKINIVMITGDHKLTAKAIGEELGILGSGEKIIDGEEFNNLTKEELQNQIEDIKIFARVSPEHKVSIIEALKKNNHIVAMTGDGINDAPSLKQADIGIAMGITGTDVSKEASDMILADDNFATIVKAVREGRVIYDNLKKFILFLLSCNISEIFLLFIAMVFGSYIFRLVGVDSSLFYIPLLPAQILWMNLITDGFPAFALGLDIPEKSIMERAATKRREQILSKNRLVSIIWKGSVLALGSLFIYFSGPKMFNTQNFINDRAVFQTSVFTTLVLSQLFYAYSFRFVEEGLFKRGIFSNKLLNISVLISTLLQLGIIYVPFLQKVFNTASLELEQWYAVLPGAIVPVLLINLINKINERKKKL